MSDKHPTENSTALIIGGETKVVGLAVAGRLFVFSPVQMSFLLALQKLKSVIPAALSVDKTEEWAQGFLKSRKFREYISYKMQEFSVKNGLTVEWWYQFGKQIADGFKEFYVVECPYCEYKGQMPEYDVETYRNDEMKLDVPCPVCFKPAKVELRHEDFEPSREQVVAWQDLGARLIPKVERVHHQFENVDIKFESEEAPNG
jgi:hypothetical protein